MRQLAAILRQEWRLQSRSTRFRLGIVIYVVLASIPALLTYFFVTENTELLIGGNTYLGQLLLAQPFATAVLAILIAGNSSHRQAMVELWIPLASARMSSLGYLLRRYLAQQMILLPVTLLPLALAWGLTLASGNTVSDLVTWLGHWALSVWPVAWIIGAFWLGMSVLAGGELVALLFSLIGLKLFSILLDQAFWPWRLRVAGLVDGVRAGEFTEWISWMVYLVERPNYGIPLALAASQGNSDLPITVQWVFDQHVLASGLALLALTLASGFLRRTERDLQPIRVSEQHALRSYIGIFNRLRQRHAPDACLDPRERLGLILGILLLLLAVGYQWKTQRAFQGQAQERFETLTEWTTPPLPLDLEVGYWKIRGELEASGRVRSLTEGEMTYHGKEPLPQLAFTLNQDNEVLAVEVAGRQIRSRHQWDRWIVDLDPPMENGDRITLRARIEGQPRRPFFGFYRGRTFRSFVDGYESYRGARFSRELVDFGDTDPRPAVNRRRVDLQPGDLGPIPRFSPWTLTPRSTDPGEFGQQVPEETFQVPSELDVEIQGPRAWTLADGCGQISRPEGDHQVLTSRCRTSLTRYVVRGGSYHLLEDPENGIAMAVLPGHLERGQTLLRGLSSVIGLSERAWPGLQGLRGIAVLEWPPLFEVDLMKGLRTRWWDPYEEELDGSLLTLPESLVIGGRPLQAEVLVGRVMARDLLTRRTIEPSQAYLFKYLFTGLTVRRMGLDDKGAVLFVKPWNSNSLRMPLLLASPEDREVFELRLPAVMAELEHRVGSHHFYSAVEAFLDRQDGTPGTIEELFDDLEARSGVSLERFFREHFLESTLPFLQLEEVRRRPLDRGRWEVVGHLKNTGLGMATCPLSIATETAEERIVVTVDSKSSTPFTLETTSPPLGVKLDPQRTCFRMYSRASPELEKADLVGTENGPS